MEVFSALLALCEGNPPATGGFPSQRPVMRSFDVSIDVWIGCWKKQSSGWWFEIATVMWRHCNVREMLKFSFNFNEVLFPWIQLTLTPFQEYENVFSFSIISRHWNVTVIWHPSLCPHYTCLRSCPDLGFCPDRKITAIERDKRKLILTWSC